MNIYLTGPAIGAFEEATAYLVALGHSVRSPLDNPFRLEGRRGLAVIDLAGEWETTSAIEADAIVVLPGWEDSPAAMIEVLAASAYDVPVLAPDQIPKALQAA